MLETLKALCALPGVSGQEDAVRGYLMERVRPHARAFVDPMGNLLVEKPGKRSIGKTILFAAHMDEVGVIVTHITDEGYLRFAFVGGVDRRVVIGKRVKLGRRGVPGVIGLKPVHMTTAEERKSVPKVEDLYIDIGVSGREAAERLVSPGDTGCFDTAPEVFGDGYLAAKAIDDRVGCAAMVKLIEQDLPVDAWFAFTVQEEVGCRGAFGAGFKIRPDMAFILEGTTSAALPGVTGGKRICAVDGGVVIPFMDGGTIYDRPLYTRVTGLADSLGIPWQTKQYIAGGTDASAIQRSRGGVPVSALAVPLRNIHSPNCVGRVEEIENLLRLSEGILRDIGEKNG